MSSLPALKRGIRFHDLVLFCVVVVFSVRWTATAAAAGPGILVVWVAALLFFFLPLAACVMELSSRYPQEGGIYVWTREAFGDFSGFVAAWAYWMSNLPFFASVLYFGGASALFAFGARGRALSASPAYYVLFAVFWLLVITLLNVRGVDVGKWLNNVCALGWLLPLTALFVLSVASLIRFGPAQHITRAALTPHWSLDNAVFWSTVFFAFSSIEAASSMGEEIQDPRRNMPWAVLIAGCIITIGYIGGTAAFIFTVPAEAVAGPDGFINGIRLLAARFGVSWMLAPMALLVALNAVGGAAANLSAAARLPFVAGADHYLPPAFGWVHARYRTPWIAIWVYGAAGIIIALLGQAGTTVRGAYDVLVNMSVISLFIPYLFLFAAMIRLQKRSMAEHLRRVPGGRPIATVLASVGLVSTAVTIVLSALPPQDAQGRLWPVIKVVRGTLTLIGIGVVVFAVGRSRARAASLPRHAASDLSV